MTRYGRPFVEDLIAFYIPERVIASIAPAAFLKFKMAEQTIATTGRAYRDLVSALHSKTGLTIMLIYCHKNITDAAGGSLLHEIDSIKCMDGKFRRWGTPSYDILKLRDLAIDYGKGQDINELGLFPIRWTPESKPDGSPIYP